MNRRLNRTTDIRSASLGKTWNDIGQDGGTEASAWRGWNPGDEFTAVELGLGRFPSSGHFQTRGRGIPPSRTWANRLLNDGLMAPIFLGGLVLLPFFAWLAGVR